jgi:hypothetical protein
MAINFVRKIGGLSRRKPVLRYFDEGYYLRAYPHVADHELSPVEHYLLIGWKERNDPGPDFSTRGYLDANPDVAVIRVNPLLHFLQNGIVEGLKGWEKTAGGD